MPKITSTAMPANFVNILTEMQKESDLAYAMKTKNYPIIKNCLRRTPKQIRQETLSSERVQRTIDEIVAEKKCSRKYVEAEADKIADEMFHNFDMKTARTLAYIAKKCLPRLFSAIYVDSPETIQKIRQISINDPVLFVPSHRTYMDFIILQFVCYHFEIPLPAIASAIDFMQMKIMGEMLRRSGAYFIRRSFKENPLYRAIFTEYVQTQICHAERPLEVFVEGTRSRTGKSLHPKYGFLSTVLEPFLSNQAFDIAVVPVNLSFTKTLEESLYAYELMGISKPRESTSGLLKARSLLGTNFGDVYVTFGEPLSLRDYFNANPLIDRSLHCLTTSFQMTEAEKCAVQSFAHKIIKLQESRAVVNLWSLAALEMNAMLAYSEQSSGQSPIINFNELRRNVDRLYDILCRLGHRIPLRTGSLMNELNYYLNLHKNIIVRSSDNQFLTLLSAAIPVASPRQDSSVDLVQSLIGSAVPRLILTNFSNQSMHLLAEVCYLAVNFSSRNLYECPMDELFNEFVFLQKLYGREFVFEPEAIKQNFELAISRSLQAKILENSTNGFIRCCGTSMEIKVLKRLFEPWLVSYSICVDFMQNSRDGVNEKQFCRLVQDAMAKKLTAISDFEPRWYQIMSLDTLKNAFHSMIETGAAKQVKSSNDKNVNVPLYHGDDGRLVELKMRLEKYLSNCYSSNESSENAKVRSKL